ncbi:MAG TPA: hypothetical protein VK325_05470 [Pseudoxanthomonas sp.]|nr:hypothetical protein [Pseudoxanthomonas sp.]
MKKAEEIMKLDAVAMKDSFGQARGQMAMMAEQMQMAGVPVAQVEETMEATCAQASGVIAQNSAVLKCE